MVPKEWSREGPLGFPRYFHEFGRPTICIILRCYLPCSLSILSQHTVEFSGGNTTSEDIVLTADILYILVLSRNF